MFRLARDRFWVVLGAGIQGYRLDPAAGLSSSQDFRRNVTFLPAVQDSGLQVESFGHKAQGQMNALVDSTIFYSVCEIPVKAKCG